MNFNGSVHGLGKMDVANGHKASHKVAAVAAESSWKREPVIQASSSSSSSSLSYSEELPSSARQRSKERLFCSSASLSSSSSSPSTYRDPSLLTLRVHAMEALISGVFASISSLKSAFLQLHTAHDPYESAKMRLAESVVLAELKKFSELKQTYRARIAAISAGSEADNHHNGERREDEGKDGAAACDRMMSSFNAEIQSKEGVIRNLREALGYMEMKKEKLEKKVHRLEKKLEKKSATWSYGGDGFVKKAEEVSTTMSAAAEFSLLSPCAELLEQTVIAASEASKDFAKQLVSLMKSARWDIDAAANAIEPGIVYARETDKKFAFESYVSRRMLSGFENMDMGLGVEDEPENQTEDACFREFLELSSAMEPEQMIKSNLQGAFAMYCLRRFLDLIHPKMEESFFGHDQQQQQHLRKQVSKGKHPFHSQFYQSFLKLSKAMWMLHKLAFSFRPHPARIFEVRQGEDFSALYMESIVQQPWIPMDNNNNNKASANRPKVCFTVMPGFRVNNTIIKCQVYVSTPLH